MSTISMFTYMTKKTIQVNSRLSLVKKEKRISARAPPESLVFGVSMQVLVSAKFNL
jgi:hypothetical protein